VTPEALPDPVAVAVSIAEALNRVGVRYVVGGSFASSLYGEPRSTNDIDVVADLSAEKVQPLADALGPEYYISVPAADEAVRTGGSFNIIHMRTAVKVDLFIAGSDSLDRERLRRRRHVNVSGDEPSTSLFVDTPEDTILRKLEWFQRGGRSSERQWRDVVGVLRIQHGALDESYLREWASRLQITDLLDAARAEADPPAGSA
jgi:hypothetical protein